MWNWFEEESGQGIVEYALIIASIALLVIVALSGIGERLVLFFEDALEKFPS